MFTRRFEKNTDDKIVFTERELKNLLDEVYRTGYEDGHTVSNAETFHYISPTWLDWKKNNIYTYKTIPYKINKIGDDPNAPKIMCKAGD